MTDTDDTRDSEDESDDGGFQGRGTNLPFDPPEDDETVEVEYDVDDWDVTNYGSEPEAIRDASSIISTGPGPRYARIARWQHTPTGESRFAIGLLLPARAYGEAYAFTEMPDDGALVVPYKYKTDDATNCVTYRIEAGNPNPEAGTVIIEQTQEQYRVTAENLADMLEVER